MRAEATSDARGSPDLRREIISHAGRHIRTPEVTDALLAALDDPTANVRKGAIRALGMRHTERGVLDAIKGRRDGDKDESVREAAESVLRLIESMGDIPK